MLYIFNSGGGLDRLKSRSDWFEATFLSIQIRSIIFIVSVCLSLVSYYYLRVKGFNLVTSFATTIFILWIVRKALLTIGKALIKLKD